MTSNVQEDLMAKILYVHRDEDERVTAENILHLDLPEHEVILKETLLGARDLMMQDKFDLIVFDTDLEVAGEWADLAQQLFYKHEQKVLILSGDDNYRRKR